jgi:uncharacterized membrane protein YgdD (TMEM256/DUF423 family)
MSVPSQRWLLFLGALLGFVAVAAGAFGAHALKNKLSQEMLAIFDIGTRYQLFHALAICITAWVSTVTSGNLALIAGWNFFFGTLIFSGSLYLLALTGIKLFGAITPIGGILLLIGWLCLASAAFS